MTKENNITLPKSEDEKLLNDVMEDSVRGARKCGTEV